MKLLEHVHLVAAAEVHIPPPNQQPLKPLQSKTYRHEVLKWQKVKSKSRSRQPFPAPASHPLPVITAADGAPAVSNGPQRVYHGDGAQISQAAAVAVKTMQWRRDRALTDTLA